MKLEKCDVTKFIITQTMINSVFKKRQIILKILEPPMFDSKSAQLFEFFSQTDLQ